MTPIEHLRELMSKATPLPWTGECLGGRELADAGILADVESVSSPFARANHSDDLAFTVTAINALPQLLAVVEAAQARSDFFRHKAEHLTETELLAGEIEHDIAIEEALAHLTTPKE